jgi:hypothetical protein
MLTRGRVIKLSPSSVFIVVGSSSMSYRAGLEPTPRVDVRKARQLNEKPKNGVWFSSISHHPAGSGARNLA